MSWGERAQIKELREEIERLKKQLRVSGELAFKAGYRRASAVHSHMPTQVEQDANWRWYQSVVA